VSARVAEPRPASAWLLVAVASATLWITEQLVLPVIAAQIAMLAFSFYHRLDPHPWQRSDIALNVLMMAITATTIAVALQGNPSTISLAYFAALTQGLQLLDVRPRKSEFLLVALALFQVILAANLTDSVWFPPLLAVFTVSATWTLLVHTLRTEAIAADEPHAADDALTSHLARTTVVATAAAIGLALVFFVALPRLKSSMVTGGVRGSQALSGFSDEVALGAIGEIRKDPRVVLRVETLEGEAPAPANAYWRGLAFDAFDGHRWSISPLPDSRTRRPIPSPPRFGVEIAGGLHARPRPTLVQRVIREPVASGVLFGSGTARRIEGALNHVETDRNDGLYTPSQVEDRVQYSIWTVPRVRDEAQLRADALAVPRDRVQGGSGDRYLALPRLDPAVAALASEITSEAASDAERALAIESWLRTRGRYTDTPPVVDEDDPRTPVEAFLLDGLSGHCEYFASAMVVLARSASMPARLVNGFAGGRANELGGFVSVTRADAHAWVELHYAGAGWVRYDPTPPDLRMRALGELGLGDRLAELGDALETWWFRRVVEFDSADQIAALKGVFGMVKRFRASSSTRAGDGGERWRELPRVHAPSLPTSTLALYATSLLSFAVGLRRLAAARTDAVPEHYRKALGLLAGRGYARRAAVAARDFARSLHGALAPEAARAFDELTELYLAERFGQRPSPDAAADALARLRSGLARARA
jgi:transglutaminase-like putative cysteine protease